MNGLEVHEASSTGDVDTLEDLINTGKYDLDLKDPDFCDRTALHWACQRGYVDCARLLLEYGADGSARMENGWTPAHCAAEAGKLTALRTLVSKEISVHEEDSHGDKPSRVAERYGHIECVKYLKAVEEDQAEKKRKAEEECIADSNILTLSEEKIS